MRNVIELTYFSSKACRVELAEYLNETLLVIPITAKFVQDSSNNLVGLCRNASPRFDINKLCFVIEEVHSIFTLVDKNQYGFLPDSSIEIMPTQEGTIVGSKAISYLNRLGGTGTRYVFKTPFYKDFTFSMIKYYLQKKELSCMNKFG